MRLATAALVFMLALPSSPQESPEKSCSTCSKKGPKDWRYCPFDGSLMGADSKGTQDYKQEIIRGALKIELVSFTIGRPKVKRSSFGEAKETVLEEECAIVKLKLTNVTDVKKVDYTSPGDADKWSLGDEFDNTYHSMLGSGMGRFDEIEGARWRYRKAMNPDASVDEVLLFQLPVKKASKFVLSLNGSDWGAEGWIKISFPRELK